MRHAPSRVWWLRCAALCALWPASTLAQTMNPVTSEPSFSVERLQPAPGPNVFLQVEDGDVAPHLGTTFALVGSFMRRPLVVYHALTGETLSEPVRFRSGADVLVGIGLWDRFQLGLVVPVVVYQEGDRLNQLDLEEQGGPLGATMFGDLRLHAKVRILEPAFGYGLAAATDLIGSLPTGDPAQFAGDRGTVVEARLIASYRARRWALGLNLSPRVRSEETEFLAPGLRLASELSWGGALAAWIPGLGPTQLMGELAGVWSEEGHPSPAEARFGLRVRVASAWTIGAHAGGGLGTVGDIGAPSFRAVVEVRHDPSARLDTDRDGIHDIADSCPLEAEDVDGVGDRDGCVDSDDDGDGVADVTDRCPREAEDFDRFKDDDGCPEADNDGDGIPDPIDHCPNIAEDRDGFADDDGCQDGDNDSDGIADTRDVCPDKKEDPDGREDGDGCPDLDDDRDGVPEPEDRCPSEVEDRDGWQDDDGCLDPDDDRDGVRDEVDRCPGQAETVSSFSDEDDDGCPDGEPMARVAPDGTFILRRDVRAAFRFRRGRAELTPQAEKVVLAISRAALGGGGALDVTLLDDRGTWSQLAEERSRAVVSGLQRLGVKAKVVPREAGRPEGIRRSQPEPAR